MHFVAVVFHVQSIEVVFIVERFLWLAFLVVQLVVQLIVLEVNVPVQVDYHRVVHLTADLILVLVRLVHLIQLICLVHLVQLVVRLAGELVAGQIDRFALQRVH